MFNVGGDGATSLLNTSASWSRAVTWVSQNLVKGAAGDEFSRAKVRSHAAAMAVLAEDSAYMRFPQGKSLTVLVIQLAFV